MGVFPFVGPRGCSSSIVMQFWSCVWTFLLVCVLPLRVLASGGPFAWSALLQERPRRNDRRVDDSMSGATVMVADDSPAGAEAIVDGDQASDSPQSFGREDLMADGELGSSGQDTVLEAYPPPQESQSFRAESDHFDTKAEAADMRATEFEKKAQRMKQLAGEFEAKAQTLKSAEASEMRRNAATHAQKGQELQARADAERRKYRRFAHRVSAYDELADEREGPAPMGPKCRDICGRDTTCLVECRVCEYNCDRHDQTDPYSTIRHCIDQCYVSGLKTYGSPEARRHWKARIGAPEFDDFDANGDGRITRPEAAALREDLGLTYPEMKDIFDTADLNGDQEIDKDEWQYAGRSYVRPEHEEQDLDNYGQETTAQIEQPLNFDFAALDANRDGKISRDEITSYMDHWVQQVRATALTLFDAVDRDHDGFLTREEFSKAGQNYDEDNLGGEVVDANRVAQRADGNGDGSVCAHEAAARMNPSQRKAFFKYFDSDGDGCVTPKELSSAPTFEALDRDGDGVINATEAQAFGLDLGVSADRMAKLVAQVDTNNDGAISRDEFESAGHIRSTRTDDLDTDNLGQEMSQAGARNAKRPQMTQVRRSVLSSRHRGRKRRSMLSSLRRGRRGGRLN